jgi:hypothetical protein
LHGKEGSKDLIDEYIKYVCDKLGNEIGDLDERKKRQAPLFGYKDKQLKWHPGIKPGMSFMFYGWNWSDKDKPLFKIEIYEGMMNRIEELYAKFDTEGEPLVVDPFSDPLEGVGLQFDRYKNEKGKWDFRIEDAPFNGKKQTWKEFVQAFQLTNAQLDQLKEVKSLKEMFGRGSFKASDFKVQLSGLMLFDEKNEYNAFADDEFLSIVEQLSEQYDNQEEEQQEDAKTGKDIDKAFAQKQENLKKPVTQKTEIKKPVVKEPEPEQEENDAENDSFREDEPEQEKEEVKEESVPKNMKDDLQTKLANLRKNLGKK